MIFKNFIFLFLLISTQIIGQNTQSYSVELDSIMKSYHYIEGDKVTVYTQFRVNKNGEIIDIKARGSHLIFEEKAISLVKDLPKYNPSILKTKPIGTKFNLPFVFIIESKSKNSK